MQHFFPSDLTTTPRSSRPRWLLRNYVEEWQEDPNAPRPVSFARPEATRTRLNGHSCCQSFGLKEGEVAKLEGLLQTELSGALATVLQCSCYFCRTDDGTLVLKRREMLALADLFAWRGARVFAEARAPLPEPPPPHDSADCFDTFEQDFGLLRFGPEGSPCLGDHMTSDVVREWAPIYAQHFCEPTGEASSQVYESQCLRTSVLAKFALFFAQHGRCQIEGYLGL